LFATRSGPRRLTRQRPGVLCPAQCLPHQHRETRIGAKLATCIHCAWRTPPFHANDAIVAPNAPGPPAADSVAVYLRPWAKTHLPARARMGGSAHQSLFTFDPCDSSEPKLSLTIRLANSVLLKASFCGVLGLECPGSWRRGDKQSASGVCRWPRFGPQEHPAVPCPQNFHVKQRTVRRPHLNGTRQTMHRIAVDHSARRSSRIDLCCRVSDIAKRMQIRCRLRASMREICDPQ
jgi:hypothetical protein